MHCATASCYTIYDRACSFACLVLTFCGHCVWGLRLALANLLVLGSCVCSFLAPFPCFPVGINYLIMLCLDCLYLLLGHSTPPIVASFISLPPAPPIALLGRGVSLLHSTHLVWKDWVSHPHISQVLLFGLPGWLACIVLIIVLHNN